MNEYVVVYIDHELGSMGVTADSFWADDHLVHFTIDGADEAAFPVARIKFIKRVAEEGESA